jgi:hypothetical protein
MGNQLGIRDSALSALGIPPGNGPLGSQQTISACVMAAREPDDGDRIEIGRRLAEQARKLMSDALGGRAPTGITSAELVANDEASCEDPPGEGVRNASVEGGCCYRLILKIVTDE